MAATLNPMTEIIDICPVSELPPGGMRLVEWEDLEIAVFNCNGEILAIEDSCSHVLILSGDQLYRMDFQHLLKTHMEAKADVTGLFALQYMMDHAKEMGLENVLPADGAAERQLYVTYLASAFRSR